MNALGIHLFHIFVVGALFVAIGMRLSIVNEIPPMVFTVLGIFIIAYHAWRGYNNGWPPVNMFHMIIVGPLLVGFGQMKKSWMHEAFLGLGAATVGYKATRMYQKMM